MDCKGRLGKRLVLHITTKCWHVRDMLRAKVTLHYIFPYYRYAIMLKCWKSDPNERPSFSTLAKSISGFAEMTAGYLDICNYNPFEASIPTATTDGENHDDTTEEKPDTNDDVRLDNPPVEVNGQCPSEDEGSHGDSLL